MTCGASGTYPSRTSPNPLRPSLSWQTLTELVPMSTPTRFLPSPMLPRLRVGAPQQNFGMRDTERQKTRGSSPECAAVVRLFVSLIGTKALTVLGHASRRPPPRARRAVPDEHQQGE